MNREELDKLRNRGPCTCNSTDCEYCSMIGDFKFQGYIARIEAGVARNQLQRAVEIASGLCAHTVDSEESALWCDMLSKLIAEIDYPQFKTKESNDASEI